jgi:Arc/MetJ-type ribon-helix-helix transcriptional regulator
MSDKQFRPFPIQLEVEFLDRISEPVRDGRAKSVSDIIRTALSRYDFANVIVLKPAQLQISVRLPAMIRQNLKRISRAKHTSVGQLVRAAVEAYLPQVESGAVDQLEIPAVPVAPATESVLTPPVPRKPKKKRKPAAKRTAAKKTARRKRSKAPKRQG